MSETFDALLARMQAERDRADRAEADLAAEREQARADLVSHVAIVEACKARLAAAEADRDVAESRKSQAFHDLKTRALAAEADRERLRAALENVRMLVASKRSLREHEHAPDLLRFCAEAGVVGSVLRTAPAAWQRDFPGARPDDPFPRDPPASPVAEIIGLLPPPTALLSLRQSGEPVLTVTPAGEVQLHIEDTPLNRALVAVLLFHGGGEWTPAMHTAWAFVAGDHPATTRGLCDVVREAMRT